MKSEEKRFYEVEAFLRNELTPEAAADFAAEMAADPALREQVAQQRAQQKIEELFIEDDLRASIKDWKTELDAQEPLPSPTGKTKRFLFWVILGTLAAALLLGWWWVSKTVPPPAPTEKVVPPETPVATDDAPTQTPGEAPTTPPETPQTPKSNPEQPQYAGLAARFEEVPAFAGEGLRTGATTEDAFEKALKSLGAKKYDEAAGFFREVKPDDEHWQDAQYNLGSLLYLQKRYKQAIPLLKTAAENPDFLYSDHARWYWALSTLASGKPQEARLVLDPLLAQPKGDFFKKAQALKELLK